VYTHVGTLYLELSVAMLRCVYISYLLDTLCRTVGRNSKCQPSLQMSEFPVRRYSMLGSSTACLKSCGGSYCPGRRLRQLIGYKCPIRCHRSYPITDFENFSPDTLKMAGILHYGKVCLRGQGSNTGCLSICCPVIISTFA